MTGNGMAWGHERGGRVSVVFAVWEIERVCSFRSRVC
jgi:hypothetical protein